jgi:hypothetical protein
LLKCYTDAFLAKHDEHSIIIWLRNLTNANLVKDAENAVLFGDIGKSLILIKSLKSMNNPSKVLYKAC